METVRGVIVGGASCVGKSHLVAELAAAHPDVATLEIEPFYTSRDRVRASLPGDLEWLHANVPVPELRARIAAEPERIQVCQVTFLRHALAGRPFVTTSGSLPNPGNPLYPLLERELGIRLRHALIDPPLATHLWRIAKRRRLHRVREFREKQRRKTRCEWDAVVASADGLWAFAEEWLAQPGASRKPSSPRPRTQSSNSR